MIMAPGLYANIAARIKAGSGEKMRKPGSPTNKESAKTAKKR